MIPNVMRYCVTLFATDGGTRRARPTSLILLTNKRAAPISQAILNLSCHGIGGVFPCLNKRSSKLPLAIYSYTRQPYSGHAPSRRTMFGCLMQLSISTCQNKTRR
ncbi:hypothetical protein IHE45_03G002000 [Dioscorea alata]|nr:hypothetical protein IHE45_03G002000 [Dioscorea alata]